MEKIGKNEFDRLVNYMRDNYGINLETKLTLVEGRLWSVITQKGFASLDDYVRFVIADNTGQEAKTLLTKLTTNYTYFMREEIHYTFLREQIVPRLMQTLRDKDLRIWSAGCSSGEEPYTTAMVLDDVFGPAKAGWDTKILATDISPLMLSQAKEGIYPAERLQNLQPTWKAKYFTSLGQDKYQIKPLLRDEVIFRPFNLMETQLPFKRKFHVIFCRNVMIYFNKQTRDALVNRFFHALEPGGYFFVGLSETLSKGEAPFTFVQPSIYKKEI